MASVKEFFKVIFGVDTTEAEQNLADTGRAIDAVQSALTEAERVARGFDQALAAGTAGASGGAQNAEEMAASAARAAKEIEGAFRSLGVKTEATAESQKQKYLDAYAKIQAGGTASADELARAQAALQSALDRIDRSAGQLTIADAFRNLGVTSTAATEAMRARMIASFEAIRTSGTASAQDIAAAEAALQDRLRALSGEAEHTATNWHTAMEGISAASGKLLAGAQKAALAIGVVAGAGIAAAKSLFGAVNEYADRVDDLNDVSAQTDLSVTFLSQMQWAAKKTGVAFEQFTNGYGKLRKSIADAASGNKAAVDTFAELGVKIQGANGQSRDAKEVLFDLADALAKMPDSNKRAALASKMFGEEVGKKLLPMLGKGRAGINAFIADSDRVGASILQETADAANSYNDNLEALQAQLAALKGKILSGFFQPLMDMFQRISDFFAANKDAIITGVNAAITPLIAKVTEFFNRKDAVDQMQKAVTALVSAFVAAARAVGFLLGHFEALKTVIVGLGIVWLIGTIGSLVTGLAALGPAIAAIAAVAAGTIGTVVLATAGVIAVIGLVAVAIYQHWDKISAVLAAAWAWIKETATAAWEYLKALVVGGWTALTGALATGWATIQATITGWIAWIEGGFSALFSWIGDQFSAVVGRISEVASSVKNAFTSIFSDSAPAIPGHRAGGPITGPGTETSDSILARLSRGEFVINAAAVRYWGADFISAINAMVTPRLPVSPGLMPAFAGGGLVAAAVKAGPGAFARSGVPVHLHLPGGEVAKMTASDDVVKTLERSLRNSQAAKIIRPRG